MTTPITDLQFWHILVLVIIIGFYWNPKCECNCAEDH